MKVSLNTIKQFTDVDLSVDELKDRISSQLGAIEEVVDLGDKYKDTVIVKVVSVEKHPNADKLHICRIDDGGVVADVERGDDGLVQIVCGAPNVHADMFAVWLPPRSIVPASYDDETPLVLEARALRGVVSQGMLAAGDELAINSEHDGIVELTHDDIMPENISARVRPLQDGLQAGASFAAVFGLDDTIIDIENKMFTHRPDLFGQLGVAREIAGIQQRQFDSPAWYKTIPVFASAEGLELEVFNDSEEDVPRFIAVAMKGVKIKPSPLWLQCALVAMGSKPINNIVDITNYVMLITAQPVHAYDYNKIRGRRLGARKARLGESVTLLNNKTYKLTEDDIVIADAQGPVGLAGIMGGRESEVSRDTKNIVLEVASFNMYAVRKSSMRHGVFTDALTRYNKGQSPLQNDRVLNWLMVNLESMLSVKQASNVVDIINGVERTEPIDPKKPCVFNWRNLDRRLYADPDFINARLGTQFMNPDIIRLLSNVEIESYDQPHPRGGGDSVEIVTPFWRTDIEQSVDIVEEVGRLYGYDKLPRTLPTRSSKPIPLNPNRELADRLRGALARAGANEVLTYSFVHGRILKAAEQSPDDAYQVSNALSPDLQYYRLSLTPSLLDKVHANIRAGYDRFALFEIGKVHTKRAPLDDIEGLPPEIRRVALTYAAKKKDDSAAYYDAKAILEFLATQLGMRRLAYKPLGAAEKLSFARVFEPLRSSRVIDTQTEQVIGVIGEYRIPVQRAFKLPPATAGFELFPDALDVALKRADRHYRPLGKYPSTERDVSYIVDAQTPYQSVLDNLYNESTAVNETMIDFRPVAIYQADESSQKTITVRMTIHPHDRTLSSDEANKIAAQLNEAVITATDATVV